MKTAPFKRPSSAHGNVKRRRLARSDGIAAWNKSKKRSKSESQFMYVPREDVGLFLAVVTYFAAPVYAATIWLGIVTHRRISEVLRIRACDLHVSGGRYCDFPHIWFGTRASDPVLPGQGKLGSDDVVARIDDEAVENIKHLQSQGLEWCQLPDLEPYTTTHPNVFKANKPLRTSKFRIPEGDALLFPALQASKQPWMSRQAVWGAVRKSCTVMHALTGKRRYNPDSEFRGARVCVHGATRHTGAALLLFNPKATTTPPTKATIMELQQRHDSRTFDRHYHHAHERQVEDALNFASIGSPLRMRAKRANDLADSADEPCAPLGQPEDAKGEHDHHEASSASGATSSQSRPAMSAIEAAKPTLPAQPEPNARLQHTHPSRNAWRKKKRNQGRKQWQSLQNIEEGGL